MKIAFRTLCGSYALAWLILISCPTTTRAELLHRRAKDTLTAVELDHGDELQFRLQDDRLFRLVLEDTSAAIVEEVKPGGIVYRFSARVLVDGQPMLLERLACCQESFYEPYVVNGVRIWLDIVRDVFDRIPVRYPKSGNLRCVPRKDARIALQDARLRICPAVLHPWIEDERDFIDVGHCYNGDDCYLGPYLGQACHVGMDINHAKGSPLFAPLDFDTHAYFNSVAMGHNNNRWRGLRRWPNGEVWALQTHHLIQLVVPENAPLKKGSKYATTAGVHVGSHEHTHFEFKIGRTETRPASNGAESSIAWPIDFDDASPKREATPQVLHLDPWIVFWQVFEDRRERRGEHGAAMDPLMPCRTGEPVTLSARPTTTDTTGGPERYRWTFGDGGSALGPVVEHVFVRAGVYPVTLTLDDGTGCSSTTQHISVSGSPLNRPVLGLATDDDVSFRPRPVHAMDVYGWSTGGSTNTLHFVARATCLKPNAKTVQIRNLGNGELGPIESTTRYASGKGWICVLPQNDGERQSLTVSVDATGLAPGVYSANVQVSCTGAVNGDPTFGVQLRVLDSPPATAVTIDDRDPGFYATPWFWVGHRFCRCPADRRGHAGFYLTNGGRPTAGEFARFTPDLQAGRYEVSLSPKTPFLPGTQFSMTIRHAKGLAVVRVRPDESRIIGTWDFREGTDGYAQIDAKDSTGLVMADAITFERQATPQK